MENEERLEKDIRKLDLGEHLCCIYRDKEEQLSVLAKFMVFGLENNEKCVYIVDDRTKEEVVEAFEGDGIPVHDYVDSGQFVFLTKRDAYLQDGYFDPDEMIYLLGQLEENAIAQGYKGVRATGEMTWFFSDLPGTERLMEYEFRLNEFLPDSRVIGLCQYNENRFTPGLLLDVIHTHPKVLLYDELHENPYYMPTDVYLARLKGKANEEHYENAKNEIIKRTRMVRDRKKAEDREDFLHSLLRHDLRNKAQVVEGYLELLEDFDLPEKAKTYLEKASKANEEGVDLIEKVKTIRDAREEEVKIVDIDKIVRETMDKFVSSVGEMNIDVEMECEEVGCKVEGGPLLTELFSNILENSIRHSGGVLLRVSSEEKEEEIVFSIEDDGRGIPDDVKDRIFERGFREGKAAGTGLGMFLVKEISESYGGRVEVKDSELGGARFDVCLKKA